MGLACGVWGRGVFPCEELVRDECNGPEVALLGGLATLLLWTHVGEGAHPCLCGRFTLSLDMRGMEGFFPIIRKDSGDPEISDLHAFRGQQNVGGLEVAVDDPGLVGVADGVEELSQASGDFVLGDDPAVEFPVVFQGEEEAVR